MAPLYRGPQKSEQLPGKDSYIQQDFLDRTAGRGEARIGQLHTTGLPEQNSCERRGQDGTCTTNGPFRTARTGLPEKDSQDRTAKTGEQGQDC
jgi:hypothetical protein